MNVPLGFPDSLVVKNPPANPGVAGLTPRLRKFPGVGNGNPLQYSSLENSVDRGDWRAAVLGFTESETTKRLSARAHTHTHTHTHTHSLLSTWLRIVKMILT